LENGHETRGDQQALRKTDLGCGIEPQGRCAERGKKPLRWGWQSLPIAAHKLDFYGWAGFHLIEKGRSLVPNVFSPLAFFSF
jgi:hypothetical protein